MARARPARFFMPPLNCDGKRKAKDSMRTSASLSMTNSSMMFLSSAVCSINGRATFSATVSELHNAPLW